MKTKLRQICSNNVIIPQFYLTQVEFLSTLFNSVEKN